jgi:hypothetical protein
MQDYQRQAERCPESLQDVTNDARPPRFEGNSYGHELAAGSIERYEGEKGLSYEQIGLKYNHVENIQPVWGFPWSSVSKQDTLTPITVLNREHK